MKKIFDNNKMMFLFIGVFALVFGVVVNTIGKKTYSEEVSAKVCSDPMAIIVDGLCTITRYVECTENNATVCSDLLPKDGFNCTPQSVTEEDGGYSHEFECTKEPQTIVKIDKPKCNSLTYTGIRQFLIDTSINYGYTVSNNERTDVGTQTVTVKLKDGFVWADDNSSNDYNVSCTINKYQTDITLEPGTSSEEAGSFVVAVNGGRLCPGKITVSASDNMTSENSYEISSDTSKTISYKVTDLEKNGSLTIKYDPNNGNNCLSDTATFEYKYSSDTAFKKIAKPVCATGLEYDKNEKQLISNLENGYSLTIKDKNGTVISSPVDAGTYTVTAKLNSRYTWSDDTKDDVEINCAIEQAKSSVSVSPTSGSGKVGYLTSTNATVSSKCTGSITLITDGLEYTGTTSFPLKFNPSKLVRELNFKVTRTCGMATATVEFKSESTNCTDGSAVYTYNVNEGENCKVDIDEKIEIPYDEVKCPENLVYDGKAKTVILPNDSRYTIRINNVSGVNKIQNVGTYVISAEINKPEDYSWVGTDETTVILKTCTITSGSSTDETNVNKNPTTSGSSSDKPNVNKNPTTGSIMLFIVWIIGFGAIGYSFYTFKACFKN